MSSDYELDSDEEYYDDEEMIDGTQDDASEDEMDMDDYNDDFRVDTGSKKKAYEIDYQSLTQSDVEKLMKQDIDHVVGITGVDESTAALLLRHSNWNKERLIEKYMDNLTTVVVEAGVTAPEPTSSPPSARTHSVSSACLPRGGSSSKPSSTASHSHPPPPSFQASSKSEEPEPFVCPICFDDSAELHPLSLDCGHLSCSGCWAAYITSKIRDEGEHAIRCMAEGCALVAPDPFIRNVLLPPEGSTSPPLDPKELKANQAAWNRFQELLARNFVASISSLKFCPYPGCTRTVKCPTAASKSSLTTIVPTVSCGSRGIPVSEDPKSQPSASLLKKEHKFCFGCTVESDHRPVVCGVAKMWLKKCEDDSETANWIKSNTKECSQCQSTIEKNGGCNHMTCKKCKHEFCWVCMGPWSEHGTQWYSCNRYDEKAGVDARDVQSQSRASLERYLHYYNRWANHEQSAKLSVDLYAKTEKKMEDMQLTSELTWIEVQFMKKAVEEAEKCRMTLKWTYAMAYYLAPGNEKELFEDNQRDLEKAVEDLSELLESSIEAEEIATLRQRVTDKTVYVQKRNDIVLDDTAKGFLEGRWRWNALLKALKRMLRLKRWPSGF
ncbi:hypothetical protein D9758_011530 [Tetrapyrgos nigripes]|uniref:RBR-type E3 ubiquitin transferase n=1 Tax=Tetrapyrgos nigripes TaxID=182062 RepID=A0A8H5FRE0_9AGAR|nr:hypothetical protein D9758_011530 [Tetrapyrgos nigripes]